MAADLTAWASLMVPGDGPPSSVDQLFAAGRPAWYADAACREHPELTWHPELGQTSAPAKAVCATCLVRDECLAYGLADPHLEGIWGGTAPRERARLRRSQKAA